MPKRIDLTGQRFGRLTVVEYCDPQKDPKHPQYRCRCDCGNESIVQRDNFKRTNSCGCLRIEQLKERATTHGMSSSPEFKAWCDIRERCYRVTKKGFHRYGARGIAVCERWLASFESFYADMGDRPSAKHSIDRIDNERGYEPSNCRWATATVQRENQSRTILFTVNGITGTAKSLASHFGLSYSAVHQLLWLMKWTPEKTFATPVKKRAKSNSMPLKRNMGE